MKAQHINTHKLGLRALANERGYMAVFIALIFQVLFVFFAMVINIGLLVHDKINLQNSVDLAAYYAAAKQAEMLNTIAHSNYQIRQSWKLLSWRVRALGDMASRKNPLLKDSDDFQTQNGVINPRDINFFPQGEYPVVCTSHSWWADVNPSQNACKRITQNLISGGGTVKFPDPPPPIAFFLPINIVLFAQIQQLQQAFESDCKDVGPKSWDMTIRWMGAYKGDIANRVGVINALARNMSSSDSDFTDLANESVREGAQKTLEKNLTRSNADGVQFNFYNSLGHPAARDGKWLHKIAVYPRVFYYDPAATTGSCQPRVKGCEDVPEQYKNNPQLNGLGDLCKEPPNVDDPYHSTVGFEKNPWIMAYVGVEASVSGRRPFAPFGGTVELRARAFAKPFGGRIGPWYKTLWEPSSNKSNNGPQVDLNLPEQRDVDSAGVPIPQDRNLLVPNYSRYPGDQIGLRSELSLYLLRERFVQEADNRLTQSMWGLLPNATFNTPSADVLAWTPAVPGQTPPKNPPWIRVFEVASVSPDLFDVAYYSIDPEFFENYIDQSAQNFFGAGIKPRPDLGHREDFPDFNKFSVLKQIAVSKLKYDPFRSIYIIFEPEKLLTSWAPNQTAGRNFDYEFPDSVFAKCPGGFRGRGIPGGCVGGGRAGYSVKLVSEPYLKDGNAATGGGGITGPLRNPPP